MRNVHLLACFLTAILLLQIPLSSIGNAEIKKNQGNSFKKGLELYSASNYISAEKIFTELIGSTQITSPEISDYEYYRLMCIIKQNKTNADAEVQEYLKKPIKSSWHNQLYFELGKLQFAKKQYSLAVGNFKKVNASKLNKADRDDLKFYSGYGNFEAGDSKAAKQAFFEIKNGKSLYSQSASYYWGYMNYLEGNYETALKEFKQLENSREFSGFIPFYTAQIYYIQEKYDLVIEIGEKLVGAAPDDQKNELYKIIGDSYFELGNYINAVKYLDTYKGKNGKKSREDFYRLAYCYYQMKEYQKAVDGFEKASAGKDLLAQNSFYHLADCELNTNNKNKARVAFEQASKFSFDPKIEEDALFNYAKLTYELSYSPFNETIKAFDAYISKYPDSGRNDAAFDYLVKVYMTTRNYRDAISSIDKIKNPSPSVKEAYQRVTYYRALELYNDGQYAKAIEMFNISLKNASFNRTYMAQSIYWSAESNYKLGKYPEALSLYDKFLATPGAFSTSEYGTAHYSAGYCNFNLKKYKDASAWFRKYLAQSKTTINQKADAANRVGDCYFLDRDYDEAIKYYQMAESLASFDPDYAIFQQSVCFGLNRQFDKKMEKLKLLISKYPRSSFFDDAMYEIARTYDRLENMSEAILNYKKLAELMPQSPFTKKAYLQLGLIYYNQNDFAKSLENYKKVVDLNPQSEEAKAALVGIKNNYVEMKDVDAYFGYTQSLGNVAPYTASGQDSLFFMAAEKSYMSGDKGAIAQFEQYLQRFPNGAFKINSAFYIADNYYAKGEYSKAVSYFEEVANAHENLFTEQALIKAAELNLNAKKYQQSLTYYTKLEKIASTKWNIVVSRMGILRSLFGLENYQAAVNAASVLLNTENITANMIREANFKMGKSLLKQNNNTEALKYFNLIADDTKSEEGAEAKYLKSDILFRTGRIADCEKEINDFISKSTPHQFWLAKSFILMADVYLSKGDLFQAKHTVKSVIDNYNIQNDGIIEEANLRIKQLETREKESILPSNN